MLQHLSPDGKFNIFVFLIYIHYILFRLLKINRNKKKILVAKTAYTNRYILKNTKIKKETSTQRYIIKWSTTETSKK